MAGCQVTMELTLPLPHWRIGKLKEEQKLRMEEEERVGERDGGEGSERMGGVETAKATMQGEGLEGARQKRVAL